VASQYRWTRTEVTDTGKRGYWVAVGADSWARRPNNNVVAAAQVAVSDDPARALSGGSLPGEPGDRFVFASGSRCVAESLARGGERPARLRVWGGIMGPGK
jgi:hypothetical protein